MLRLRQICLVAPELGPVEAQVRRVLGLEVCHRDEAVAKYGLENALFVFGHQFLEIVAPTRDGTAAGRFLARHDGPAGRWGAYMAIFDTHDPERRRAWVESLGVRIAHTMQMQGFRGVQLHPRDARAAMLEFDCSDGNEQLEGAYGPAGPHWREFQRLDRVMGIPWIDVEAPAPHALAQHWSRLIEVPVVAEADGRPALSFDLGAARFIDGPVERVAALHVSVADPQGVREAARREELPEEGDAFVLGGVRIYPHAAV